MKDDAIIKSHEDELKIPKNLYYKRIICIKRRLHPSMMGDRQIMINKPNNHFPNNKLICSKYTILNFLPLVLIEQCSKLLNMFFIVKFSLKKLFHHKNIENKIIGILEVINETSIENTRYDLLIIILITIFVGAKKSLMEDLIKKHFEFKENNKLASVFKGSSFIQKKWKNIQVGEIIMVFLYK